jgi:FkbM family methyltransferase
VSGVLHRGGAVSLGEAQNVAASGTLRDLARAGFYWSKALLGYCTHRTDYFSPLPTLGRRATVRSRTGGTIRLSLRPGLSDARSLFQVFLAEEYRLDRLARSAEMRTYWTDVLASGACPLIIDCGANNGMSAAYFASAWPGSKVVAVEPDSRNMEMLVRNTAAFDVDPILAAVSDAPGRFSIMNPDDDLRGLRTAATEDGSIEGVTIPEILARYPRPQYEPFILKVDIEGAEENLFRGDTDWVDDFPLLALELHDWMLPGNATSKNFLCAVAQRNRDFVQIGENTFSIRNGLSSPQTTATMG